MDLVEVDGWAAAGTVEWQPGDAYLGGGTWLFSQPQPDTRRLLDLHAFGWPSLVAHDEGLEIGATCTLRELAGAPGLPPVVRQCCEALLGSFKVAGVATVGGNVCLALPAGPMTSLTAALDGLCVLHGPYGAVRTLPVTEFVWEPRRTALRAGEYLRAVRVPRRALTARTAMRRISLTDLGRSAALVIGRVDADGAFVLTVTASTPRPVQVRFASLTSAADAIEAVRVAVPPRGGWFDDVHGRPRWRAAMTERLVGEVVTELAQP